MPEAFQAALQQEGLWFLILIVFVSGMVRGFAGFGTGLIVVPLGGIVLAPLEIIIMIMVIDLTCTAPFIPRALRDAPVGNLKWLSLGMIFTLPIGVYLLTRIDPLAFRWVASVLTIGLVVVLLSGWRHNLRFGPRSLAAVGGVGGFTGGLVGIPGPPVILAYLSGQAKPAEVRGTILSYLLVFEILFFLVFLIKGLFWLHPILIGALMMVPYLLGTAIGTWLFQPEKEKLYRMVAYIVVLASGLLAMPLWGI